MKIIGITGGAGSGKSEVLNYLSKRYGAVICQADQVAKNLQKKRTKCYSKIVEHFGTGILSPDGRLDRRKLADIVFSDEEELAALNAIVHPAVKEKIQEIIKKEEQNQTTLFILEAALLIEGNYDTICDEIWYIYADEETRKRRLLASRGYDTEKSEHIFAVQMPSQAFFERCDRAVDNSGLFEATCVQVDEMVRQLGIN